MRGGIDWPALAGLSDDETVMDLLARMGVDRLTAGRLRSAGLMSGMMVGYVVQAGPGCL